MLFLREIQRECPSSKRHCLERGAIELMTIIIIATLIIGLALAIVPSLLDKVASKAQSDSTGQKKESALCSGDNCTDCAPGDTNCYTTSSTTTTTSGPGPGPGPGCFTGNTPVLMADGTLKPIDQIWVGDYVMSMDEHDSGDLKNLTVSRVRGVTIHHNLSILRVTVGEETIDTTDIHPFYVFGTGWVEAQDLVAGDLILSAAGDPQMVQQVLPLEEKSTVYNLFVENTNTFFVGDRLLWVHNAQPTAKNPGYL